MQNVTSEPSNPSVDGQPAPGVRAQTLALQGLVNPMVRGLLRTPLLCRVVGNRLLCLHRGAPSPGPHPPPPPPPPRHDGTLLIGTPFAWGRNLHTGEPVD